MTQANVRLASLDEIRSVEGSEFPDIAGIFPPRTDIESSVSISGKMASKSSKG